jgi:DNA polymerase-3 subunit delta'
VIPGKAQTGLFVMGAEEGTAGATSEEANLATIIESGQAWKELSTALRQAIVPQSVVFFGPSLFHKPFLRLYAQSLLGNSEKTPINPVHGENHPDLLILGDTGAPPGIDECRSLLGDLSSRPVCAPYRLAVIHAAHRLSPPAANSLLKITEEPPPRGRLLLLLEEEILLPTLRSRSWCLRMPLEEVIEPAPPPQNDEEWTGWLSETLSGKVEEMLFCAARWARWYALQGNFRKAVDLDSLVTLAQKMRLSVAMVADLIFLMLREEVSIENFFDPLR